MISPRGAVLVEDAPGRGLRLGSTSCWAAVRVKKDTGCPLRNVLDRPRKKHLPPAPSVDRRAAARLLHPSARHAVERRSAPDARPSATRARRAIPTTTNEKRPGDRPRRRRPRWRRAQHREVAIRRRRPRARPTTSAANAAPTPTTTQPLRHSTSARATRAPCLGRRAEPPPSRRSTKRWPGSHERRSRTSQPTRRAPTLMPAMEAAESPGRKRPAAAVLAMTSPQR